MLQTIRRHAETASQHARLATSGMVARWLDIIKARRGDADIRRRLEPRRWAALAMIAERAGTGECTASMASIAADASQRHTLRISPSTVRRAVQDGEALGMLHVEPRFRMTAHGVLQTANAIILTLPAQLGHRLLARHPSPDMLLEDAVDQAEARLLDQPPPRVLAAVTRPHRWLRELLARQLNLTPYHSGRVNSESPVLLPFLTLAQRAVERATALGFAWQDTPS